MTEATAADMRRQLRDFAVAALLAIALASVAFVAVRNRDLVERQLELANRSAVALADGRDAVPTVHAAIVSAATASASHPYLRHRQIFDGGRERLLAGHPGYASLCSTSGASQPRPPPPASLCSAGPLVEAMSAWPADHDKLFYDAATRFEHDGGFAELLHDGTGRAIAARRACRGSGDGAPPDPRSTTRGARDTCGIAIAITAPAKPAPYPFLVIIGVLGLGAAIAAAGALVGRRAARLGTFASIGVLAVPTLMWHAWIASTAILLIGAAVALAQDVHLTDRWWTGLRRHRTALGFVAPAMIAMLVLVAAPFLIGICIGFYDHHHGQWTFVGLDNFVEILSGGGHNLDDPLNFWFILGVTVLWTVVNVVLHVTIGVALALFLSRKWLRGRGVFRMLLILPWAIPNYITALIWKGMFDGEYGALNSLLHAAGLSDVSWFTKWATAFAANVTTNTWLGFPFMMVVALGALESIPRDLYEAAAVDGATAWQRFRHITLPHLRPALGPAVALGSIWTFNMFNVIYLVSAGKPGDSTNILVTDAYRWAFERGERYGMAAAEATIIFLILLLWTVFGTRMVRAKADAGG